MDVSMQNNNELSLEKNKKSRASLYSQLQTARTIQK